MSTFPTNTLRDNNYGSGRSEPRRSSSSAFWDQTGNSSSNKVDMETPPSNNRVSTRGLQDWEREAIMRDSMEMEAFEIGNDDYFHSETSNSRTNSRSTKSNSRSNSLEEGGGGGGSSNNAYDEVQEDIRSLEEDEDEISGSGASHQDKEEVVNAYRDYLKSIRDGGFESYLDTKDGSSPDFHDIGGGTMGIMGEDDAIERVLDIEEERQAGVGSLYGDLYGVHNMREAVSSPYATWRAKAKALLQQEEEKDRHDAISPSRAVLNRFRRKRSNGGLQQQQQQQQQRGGGGGGVSIYDESNDGLRLVNAEKMYTYRPALCQSTRFRIMCIALCLILSLAAGLSYYGDKNVENNDKEENNLSSDWAIPPKTNSNNGTMTQNNTPGDGSKKQKPSAYNSNLGPSDAVLNALKTFDPIWYNRASGWEGITFTDAVSFCLSQEDRVPCPYEIYCNEGESEGSQHPHNGDRPNGEQWSPISNGANAWVQVGGMFTCKRYTDLHDQKKPDWGITGISLEHEHGAGGITQNVMCCHDVYNIGSLDPFTQWGKEEKMKNVHADATTETTTSAVVNVQDTPNEKNPYDEGNSASAAASSQSQNPTTDLDSQKREKAVISAFQPIWFSSAHGWSGTSYEDGIIFCESYNHMVLCPYAAYCPNGQNRPALPGSMITELDGEEWVPANGPMNTWVQIGTVGGDESSRCTLHHDLLGERPEWGIDGTRSDVKHHIMCCLM
ncbi:hypothetical protein ACHAXR_008874 [Thalassiosira sp. AJA248-18]